MTPDEVAAATGEMIEAFAESVSVTSGGRTFSILAVFDNPQLQIDDGTEFGAVRRSYVLHAQTADVSSVVEGDTVVVRGVTYTVSHQPSDDGLGETLIPLRR